MMHAPQPDSPTQVKTPPERLAIGYLTWDRSPYQTLMWSGALDMAEALAQNNYRTGKTARQLGINQRSLGTEE